MALRPSLSWTVAPTGHTCSQGAFSQCMHGTSWKTTRGFSGSPAKDLLLSHEGDDVLRLARRNAGIAPLARGEVDGHAPLMLTRCRWRRPQRPDRKGRLRVFTVMRVVRKRLS